MPERSAFRCRSNSKSRTICCSGSATPRSRRCSFRNNSFRRSAASGGTAGTRTDHRPGTHSARKRRNGLRHAQTSGPRLFGRAVRTEFLKIGQAIRNDDYARSPTRRARRADPKGVVLTHRNYTANVEQSLSRIDIPSSYRTLIILPLDHCFAHVVGFYIMIACGAAWRPYK